VPETVPVATVPVPAAVSEGRVIALVPEVTSLIAMLM
jgi:hypothetical protein